MNFYLKTFLSIGLLSLVGYGLHSWLVESPAIAPLRIYSFLGIATFVTVSGLKFVHRLVPDKLGYGFLGLIFIKCGAAIVLFPELIATNAGLTRMQLLGFLTPYFIFLFIEVGMVLKWLNDN